MTRSWIAPLNRNPARMPQRGPNHDAQGRKRNRYVRSLNAVFQRRPQNSLRLVEANGCSSAAAPQHRCVATSRRADETHRNAGSARSRSSRSSPRRTRVAEGIIRATPNRSVTPSMSFRRREPFDGATTANDSSVALLRENSPHPSPARPTDRRQCFQAGTLANGRSLPRQPLAADVDGSASVHICAQRGHSKVTN